MRQLVICFLVILLASCSPPSSTIHNEYGCATYWDESSFPIVVSPDETFNKNDIIYVQEAVRRWNQAVGEEVFIVVPFALSSYAMLDLEGVMLDKKALPAPWFGFCPVLYHDTVEGNRGRVWRAVCSFDVWEMRSTEEYINVITHELGHALGMRHSIDKASIMYPKISNREYTVTKEYVDTVKLMMHGRYKLPRTRCF